MHTYIYIYIYIFNKWSHKSKKWLRASLEERERERDCFRVALAPGDTNHDSVEYSLLDETIGEIESLQDMPEEDDVFGHGFGWDDE